MNKPSGLGQLSRERLSKILRISKGIINVDLASKALDLPSSKASQFLSYWAQQGWLYRVKRGTYVSVPLESSTGEPAIEDPWIIAHEIFSPCYIGGWSAAEYWDLTEQIFQSVCVVTVKAKRIKDVSFGNSRFSVKSISPELFFGYKTVWRGQMKVNVSDPGRTIIDMLNDTKLGGGIRPVSDVLNKYMQSPHKNLNALFEYALRIKNKTVFKRLGYLMEKFHAEEREIIQQCHARISSGYSKLDPDLDADKLITRWKLWIPESWAGKG